MPLNLAGEGEPTRIPISHSACRARPKSLRSENLRHRPDPCRSLSRRGRDRAGGWLDGALGGIYRPEIARAWREAGHLAALAGVHPIDIGIRHGKIAAIGEWKTSRMPSRSSTRKAATIGGGPDDVHRRGWILQSER